MSLLNGGGCSGLFHLLASRRNLGVVVLSLTMGGVATLVQNGPPGQQIGTEAVLESVQNSVVTKYPWLPSQLESMRTNFDRMNANPTEAQVRYVLSILEPCTDTEVQEVLSDPAQRREAAWLLYLDTYTKEGATRADQLFTTKR